MVVYRLAAWCLGPSGQWHPILFSFFHESGSASSKPLCRLVSVRVGLKGTGIDDSLIVHQLVTLVVGIGVEIVGFGVTHDLVRFDDLGLARFLLRLLDFVEDVLAHHVIIQLGFALTVEPEATDFAFDFALLGFVPIILRTARHEFFDVIVGLQFTRKLSEVISQGRVGLTRFLQVNDRVGAVVEYAFTQELEGFVETITCPRGGERGHKNVEVGRHGDVFVLVLIVHFHQVTVFDGHVTHIQSVGIQETVKGLGVSEFFDLGLVETLSELAPHGIEHHFGQSAQTRIVFNLVVFQLDALVLIVLVDVLLTFGFVVTHPLGPPAGLLLDFQPGVDVVLEEALTGFFKMPHFVDVLDLVTQLDGFLQIGGAPRVGQGVLLVGVCALVRSLQERFGHFFFDTGGTERKSEFAGVTVRQHGMVRFTRGEDSTLDDTKVNVNVRVTRLRDESRMTFGVDARLVDPGVQGGVIDVVDLLTRCHVMVELDGIGTSSTEGVTGVERVHKLQRIHVRLDVGRGLFEAGPLAFPHFDNVVP